MKETIIWHYVEEEGLPEITEANKFNHVLALTKIGRVGHASLRTLRIIQNLVAWAEWPKGPEAKK